MNHYVSLIFNNSALIGTFIIMTAGGCFIILLIIDILSRKFGVFKNGIIAPLFSKKVNEEKKEIDTPSQKSIMGTKSKDTK